MLETHSLAQRRPPTNKARSPELSYVRQAKLTAVTGPSRLSSSITMSYKRQGLDDHSAFGDTPAWDGNDEDKIPPRPRVPETELVAPDIIHKTTATKASAIQVASNAVLSADPSTPVNPMGTLETFI